MAQESHLSHLPEFQSNLFLHLFLPDIFSSPFPRNSYFCRIPFSDGEGLPVTNSAPIAILFHTGRTDFLFEASLIFLPKKRWIHSCFDERPRKDIVDFSLSGMPIHFQSCLLKSLPPQGKLELIAPAVKTASQPKSLH